MPTIHVTDRGGTAHTIQVDNGLTLMEPLRELDDGIEAPEWFARLPSHHSDELELLESTENFRAAESRLACQVKVTDAINGIRLTVAPEE